MTADSPGDRSADKPAVADRRMPPEQRREAIVAERMPPEQRREAMVAKRMPPDQRREAFVAKRMPPGQRREAIVAKRMPPEQRREAIVAAALDVAVVKGLASTTVRDVAARMGTSSGLIHHYFASMDDVLAAAFELVATQDLGISERLMTEAPTPVEALRVFFRTYTPADKDWAFQLWLDAWAEAGRRPAVQATSRRLNLEWQSLLERTIRDGVASGSLKCADPDGAAWRILSLLDGLALQVVAHGTTISREDVVAWSTVAAEQELGLAAGSLG